MSLMTIQRNCMRLLHISEKQSISSSPYMFSITETRDMVYRLRAQAAVVEAKVSTTHIGPLISNCNLGSERSDTLFGTVRPLHSCVYVYMCVCL